MKQQFNDMALYHFTNQESLQANKNAKIMDKTMILLIMPNQAHFIKKNFCLQKQKTGVLNV